MKALLKLTFAAETMDKSFPMQSTNSKNPLFSIIIIYKSHLLCEKFFPKQAAGESMSEEEKIKRMFVKIVYGDHIQEIIDDIKNVTYNSIDKL